MAIKPMHPRARLPLLYNLCVRHDGDNFAGTTPSEIRLSHRSWLVLPLPLDIQQIPGGRRVEFDLPAVSLLPDRQVIGPWFARRTQRRGPQGGAFSSRDK